MKRCSKPSIITEMHFITIIPRWSVVKNPSAKQETRVQSLGWEDFLEKETATHSSILFTIFFNIYLFFKWGIIALQILFSVKPQHESAIYYILFLPGESHSQRTWQVTVHGVTKSGTWLNRLSMQGLFTLPLWLPLCSINTKKLAETITVL